MDSIVKHVQGKYIEHFEHNLPFIMGIVFQTMQYSSDDYKQKLIKIFSSWEALEIFKGLKEISNQHQLSLLVSYPLKPDLS